MLITAITLQHQRMYLPLILYMCALIRMFHHRTFVLQLHLTLSTCGTTSAAHVEQWDSKHDAIGVNRHSICCTLKVLSADLFRYKGPIKLGKQSASQHTASHTVSGNKHMILSNC